MYIVCERDDVFEAVNSATIELGRQLALGKHAEDSPNLTSLVLLEPQ